MAVDLFAREIFQGWDLYYKEFCRARKHHAFRDQFQIARGLS